MSNQPGTNPTRNKASFLLKEYLFDNKPNLQQNQKLDKIHDFKPAWAFSITAC